MEQLVSAKVGSVMEDFLLATASLTTPEAPIGLISLSPAIVQQVDSLVVRNGDDSVCSIVTAR